MPDPPSFTFTHLPDSAVAAASAANLHPSALTACPHTIVEVSMPVMRHDLWLHRCNGVHA